MLQAGRQGGERPARSARAGGEPTQNCRGTDSRRGQSSGEGRRQGRMWLATLTTARSHGWTRAAHGGGGREGRSRWATRGAHRCMHAYSSPPRPLPHPRTPPPCLYTTPHVCSPPPPPPLYNTPVRGGSTPGSPASPCLQVAPPGLPCSSCRCCTCLRSKQGRPARGWMDGGLSTGLKGMGRARRGGSPGAARAQAQAPTREGGASRQAAPPALPPQPAHSSRRPGARAARSCSALRKGHSCPRWGTC